MKEGRKWEGKCRRNTVIARSAKIFVPAILLTFLNIKPVQADTITFNNQPYVFFANICGETDTDGCTGQIGITMADGETVVTVTMGSDGEQPFDPFGFGFNVGDAISFANLGDTTVQSLGLGWTNLNSDGADLGSSWVLPADLTAIGCGVEPQTTCEPTGDFIFSQPFRDSFANSPNGGAYVTISDANGGVSDWILFANTAPGGNGEAF